MKIRSGICLLFILLFFSNLPGRDLDEIKRSGKIYVAFTKDDLKNINYDLAYEFARYLNVELIQVEISWDEAFMKDGSIPENLENDTSLSYTPDALKKADIICSTFTMMEWRKKLFGFARTLQSAELLIIAEDQPDPHSFQDLAGKQIAFHSETSFRQHLEEISASINGEIELVTTYSGQETRKLLQEKEVYGIILDADEALNFRANSERKVKIAFPISETSQMAWAVEKNNPLTGEVENFFKTIANNGILDEIFYMRFGITYASYLDLLDRSLRQERYHRDLDEILASGKLVVALRERNFIYREGGQKQFMHALAEEFADYLGVDLEFVITPDFEKYWQADDGSLHRDSSYTPEWFNYFDLACETIAPLDWRTNKVNLVPVFPSSYVVIAQKGLEINSIQDLKTLKGVTGRQSVYEEILRKNDIHNYYHSNVNDFISDVANGKADYTIVYNAFQELSEYPDLEVKLELGDLDVCWAMRKDQEALQNELEAFIKESRESGLIAVLIKTLRGQTLQPPEASINSYYQNIQTGQMPYVNYGADDGLPQEDIFAIFQDQKGYIWFGTNSGAVRYNGREMIVFNEDDGLPGNSVWDIAQDSSGCIYFATSNGVAFFRDGQVSESRMTGSSFQKIFIAKNQRPYFIGSEGVYMMDNNDRVVHLNKLFPELPASTYQLEEIPGGKIIVATILGIYMYDPLENRIEHLTTVESYSLYLDAKDSIWISTREGLLITDLENLMDGKSPAALTSLNKKLGEQGRRISQIRTSKYGSVWLVTDSRVFQVNSIDRDPIVYEQETGIKNNKILSFLIDQEDNIWIGYAGGLKRLTNRRGLRNFHSGTINSHIISIFQDRQDRIWISSNNGLYYFSQGKLHPLKATGLDQDARYCGKTLSNGEILLAGTTGLFKIDGKTLTINEQNLFENPVHSPDNMCVTSSGEIFLLSGINGVVYHFKDFHSEPVALKNKYTSNLFQLVEYDGKVIGGNSAGFVIYENGTFKLLESANCNIWTLCKEGKLLWVGTDCGLGLVNNGRFDQMSLASFNHEMVIKSILPAQNRNYLWLGTNQGFTYYNKDRQEFEFTIDSKDGLSGDEITPGGLFLDRNDLLWIGTNHGISNFNIRAKSNISYAPVCYIEKVIRNGIEIAAISGSSFAHYENNIEFEVSAISFSNEASIEYEYYLRGLENKYSSHYQGKEYRARYNNLPPGKYEFIYKAKGKNNIWGYAEKFSFQIRKAWYSTWVFRIGLAFLLLTVIYLFYRSRKTSLRIRKKELDRQGPSSMESHQLDRIIQASLLPARQILERAFPEHFILAKSGDKESGDFYWVQETPDFIYILTADCMSPVIPGSFIKLLSIGILNEILGKNQGIEAHEILNLLLSRMNEILHQEPEASRIEMNLVLMRFDKAHGKVQFAGSGNPIYLRRQGHIQEHLTRQTPASFEHPSIRHDRFEVALETGDAIFIITDGFARQANSPIRGKLLQVAEVPMKEQGQLLDAYFEQVLLIGVQY